MIKTDEVSEQVCRRHRAVPGHGHGLLAPAGGGGTGTGGGAVRDDEAILNQAT
jgi:hypothetical protein